MHLRSKGPIKEFFLGVAVCNSLMMLVMVKKTEQKQTCAWMNIKIDIFVVFGWTGLWILHSAHEIGGLRDSIHLTFKHKLKQNEICKFYDISEYKNHTGRNGLLFVLVR